MSQKSGQLYTSQNHSGGRDRPGAADPLASVILCADPEKVVLGLLQPARRRADLELWSAGWVERNRAAGPAYRGSMREVEPGNDLPAPRVVCVRGFARQPPDPR